MRRGDAEDETETAGNKSENGAGNQSMAADGGAPFLKGGMKMDEKRAYVTGADRGLGLELVKGLLQKGYHVFAGLYMTDLPDLQKLAEEQDGRLDLVQLDVSSLESVTKAAQSIRSRTEYLNLLINNAGIVKERNQTMDEDMYFDDMLNLFNVNTLGTLRVTKSVIDLLLKGNPKLLVNISSAAASVGGVTRKNQYGYTMSKAAINMQSKLIYNTYHDQGLEVRAVHPGWMHTSLFGNADIMKAAPFEPDEAAALILESVYLPLQQEGHIFTENDGTPMPY